MDIAKFAKCGQGGANGILCLNQLQELRHIQQEKLWKELQYEARFKNENRQILNPCILCGLFLFFFFFRRMEELLKSIFNSCLEIILLLYQSLVKVKYIC